MYRPISSLIVFSQSFPPTPIIANIRMRCSSVFSVASFKNRSKGVTKDFVSYESLLVTATATTSEPSSLNTKSIPSASSKADTTQDLLALPLSSSASDAVTTAADSSATNAAPPENLPALQPGSKYGTRETKHWSVLKTRVCEVISQHILSACRVEYSTKHALRSRIFQD